MSSADGSHEYQCHSRQPSTQPNADWNVVQRPKRQRNRQNTNTLLWKVALFNFLFRRSVCGRDKRCCRVCVLSRPNAGKLFEHKLNKSLGFTHHLTHWLPLSCRLCGVYSPIPRATAQMYHPRSPDFIEFFALVSCSACAFFRDNVCITLKEVVAASTYLYRAHLTNSFFRSLEHTKTARPTTANAFCTFF